MFPLAIILTAFGFSIGALCGSRASAIPSRGRRFAWYFVILAFCAFVGFFIGSVACLVTWTTAYFVRSILVSVFMGLFGMVYGLMEGPH
ncbi:MAG: hypothetical protein K2W82_11320 [Candidatus Obscuribacterales bacterium]|nr:hypothetical protein [Candidatus Obscuribacterales bacterium]